MTTHKTPDDLHDSADLHERAEWFAKQFSKAAYEMGEAQNFVRGLCDVFGINAYSAVRFEERIKKQDGQGNATGGINRIDALFPGLLLVEMKSDGKDLDHAYAQALDYIPLIANPSDQPRYILGHLEKP